MSIRKSLAWAYGGQGLTLIVNFASSVALARLLSPHEMGVFAFAMAMTGIVAVLTSLNLQSYIVREGELRDEDIRSIYTLNALANVSLASIMLAIAAAEYWLWKERDIAAVLAISSLSPLIGTVGFIPSALYQREMNYSLLSRVGIVCTIVSAAVVVGCAAAGLGAVSPAVGPVVSVLISTCYYSWRRRGDLVFRPTRHGLRPAFTFGIQIMSISGVAQMTQRLSDIVLGRLLGLSALGLYSRAANLSNIIWSNVYGMATSVVFAKLSKDLRETGSLHRTFVLSLRMLTAFIWPLIAGIGVLAGPLVHTLYGPRWAPAAPVLSLLMVYQFIALAFGMNWELFVLRRETARQTRFEMLRAAAGLATFTFGALFSITGAALGRVAECAVGYFLYRPHIDRLAGTSKGELEQVFGESLMLTVVAVTPALVLMIVTRFAVETSLALIAPAVLLGMAGWFYALVLRHHPLIDELKLALAKVRRVRGEA